MVSALKNPAKEFSLSSPSFPQANSLQPCPNLRHPMDCRPPGSSVLGILQAGILQGVAIRFSRGSSSSGIEPLSLASQADSLPAEPSGKSPSLSDQLSNMPLGL